MKETKDQACFFCAHELCLLQVCVCVCVCVSNPVPKGIFRLFCRLTFKQEALHA